MNYVAISTRDSLGTVCVKVSEAGSPICEGTISSGTLRTTDLLATFAAELERLVPFNSARLVSEARIAAQSGDDENASLILAELFEELEEIASAAGFYFGAHEGDGSDFGFWRIEDGEEDEEPAGIETATGPAAWASYLINGDATGLDREEVEAADEWIESIGLGAPVSCEPAGFLSYFDAEPFADCVSADCETFVFLA